MEAFKVTSKGQITIPKEIRELLGISQGDRVMFIRKGEDVLLRKVFPNALDRLLEVTSDVITNKEMTEEEIMEQIREVRREIAENGGDYPREF